MSGLSITDVRKLAFEIAERSHFKTNEKMTGSKWFYSFMKRHPTLSLHQPE
jgi:hypothetical protein